ncbi:hypothetical protein ABZ348_30855 [Streptomyces sp. NPDC005963]|uniref:hypothetical protein n=1 Tax=Streptomyces sp. NPDC005963 TaxID=3156721 RepID=UPI0033CBD0D4
MSHDLTHGRLAYVVPNGSGEVVLARFTQYDDEERGYFAYFGVQHNDWPEGVEIVELAVVRPVS